MPSEFKEHGEPEIKQKSEKPEKTAGSDFSPEPLAKKCPFCKTELVGGSYCPQCRIKSEI